MSKTILLNHSNWHFTKENPGIPTAVMGEAITLPHTWNAVDGQDGGNDYYRGTCWYTLALAKPAIPAGGKAILQLDGAAMTAVVYLNGEKLAEHKGGYSTFRVDLTEHLKEENLLAISVDNSDNDTVYPQKADFTFYGGIYRDVTLHVVPAAHFALAENGAVPVRVTPIVTDLNARRCEVTVEAAVVGAESVTFTLDDQQTSVAVKDGTARAVFTLEHARLWDGLDDPYLYTVTARLVNGETETARFGCRKFEIDPQKGFILNGRPYPLRGVSRHQDRKGAGVAITKEMMEEDMALMLEKGVSPVHNPTSNMKLGSGFAPIRQMMDKGINVTLGTDGTASNNNLNMFEEMHLAEIMHDGYHNDPTLISTQEVLDMATVNGAKLQGRDDTGVLAVGKKADIIAIDLSKPHLYPDFDTPALLTCSAQAGDVCMTMVDGNILYENGEFKTLDENKVRADMERAVERLYRK